MVACAGSSVMPGSSVKSTAWNSSIKSKKGSLKITIGTEISVVSALKVRSILWAVKSGSGPEAGRK